MYEFTGQQTQDELRNIAQDMASPKDYIALNVLYAAPIRPRNGFIVYADGTTWNPGSGLGFYGYENGAWVKL